MGTHREWTIEMLWRCKHCQKLNPGMSGAERESLKCVNCGAEKTDEPWVMPEDAENSAPALTGELDRRARAGANWTCQFCKGESREGHALCEICGAPRYEAKPEPPKAPALPPVAVPKPTYSSVPPVVVSKPPAPMGTHPQERVFVDDDGELLAMSSGWGWDWKRAAKVVGIGVGAVLFVLLLVWLFTPNKATVRVAAMDWSRERVLQERHSYNGEGWRGQAPGGVYSWDSCETRQNGTERCHPHDCNCRQVSYECRCTGGDSYDCNCRNVCRRSCSSNRNGSATCSESCDNVCSTCRTPRRCDTCTRTECDTCYDQCPTYAQWCRYRYYQWDEVTRQRTAGRGHGAVWPNLEARGPIQRVMESEDYRVRFNDVASDRTWTRSYSFTRYEGFNLGQRWDAEWTRAGTFTLVTRR